MSIETDLELTTMLHTIPVPPQEAPKEKELPPLPLVDIGPEEPVVVLQPREPTPDLPILHDLQPINRLFITKKLRVRNVVLLKGRRNRYLIKTSDHTLVYTIEEHNNSWAGYLCLGLRPLHLSVMNGQGTEVMRIQRPFACTGRCLPCQLQHMDVFSPPGELLGTVEQQWTAVKPVYLVKNDNGDDVFWIQGPFMTVSCYTDVQFDISRPDGTPVGATCKRWQGLTHAVFFQPVTDNFGVAFELDLTVEEKGLLLAATLLMDYMYYDA